MDSRIAEKEPRRVTYEASFLLPRYSGSSLGDQERRLLERGVGECTEGASVSQYR